VPELVFALPGDPETPTGGYGYDRRLKAGLEALGWTVAWLRLPGDFPLPSPQDLSAAVAMLEAVPPGPLILVDGLALGALPAQRLRALAPRLVALVHHPLALETGLSAEASAQLQASERAALEAVGTILVTSRATAASLAEGFGVPASRITVAEPGTDPARPARGSGGEGPVRLLSVASVTPRKGFPLLVEALASLADLDWTCRVVGSTRRDESHARAVREAVAAAGLSDRLRFEGEVAPAALPDLYDWADVFVLASLHEGYGMAFAEALARGLPGVGFAAGAVPEVVPAPAGRLVPVGDAGALARALREVVADRALRERLARGAREAGRRLPAWAATAAIVDARLRGLA